MKTYDKQYIRVLFDRLEPVSESRFWEINKFSHHESMEILGTAGDVIDFMGRCILHNAKLLNWQISRYDIDNKHLCVSVGASGEVRSTGQGRYFRGSLRKTMKGRARARFGEFALEEFMPEKELPRGLVFCAWGTEDEGGLPTGDLHSTTPGGSRDTTRSLPLRPQQKPVKSMRIGSREWMTENLCVDRFRNGDPILEVKSREEWNAAGDQGKPAWCHYDNDSAEGQRYGKLYNGHAVMDSRGLGPVGWRVPGKDDFDDLAIAVESDANALKMAGEGKGDGAGTNASGFSALLAGFRGNGGYFAGDSRGNRTGFWSVTIAEGGLAIGPSPYAFWMELESRTSVIVVNNNGLNYGFSVRCVKE